MFYTELYCYRTCLRYFLPPQWVMDKDTITTMTPQELANFPLDDFFDHYEKGLRKVRVSIIIMLCMVIDLWHYICFNTENGKEHVRISYINKSCRSQHYLLWCEYDLSIFFIKYMHNFCVPFFFFGELQVWKKNHENKY